MRRGRALGMTTALGMTYQMFQGEKSGRGRRVEDRMRTRCASLNPKPSTFEYALAGTNWVNSHVSPPGNGCLRHSICSCVLVRRRLNMTHSHEYNCVVCGAHFDNEKDLQRHDRDQHKPKLAID